MVKITKLFTITLSLILSGLVSQGKDYPYRRVYVSRSLRGDGDVSDIKSIIKTASEQGLNGMVLATGFDCQSQADQSGLINPHTLIDPPAAGIDQNPA